MKQQTRLLVAFAYSAGIALLHRVVLDQWLPPLGSHGAWFYTGLVLIALGAALAEPFYTSPANALLNAFTVLLVAVAFSPRVGTVSGASVATVNAGKSWFAGASTLIAVLALVAIFLKDSPGKRGATARIATTTVGSIGSARFLFSAVYLATAYSTYADDPGKLGLLILAWIVIVVIRPFERVADLAAKLPSITRPREGRVVGLRYPGLVEAGLNLASNLAVGNRIAFDDSPTRGAVLDVSQSSSGKWALIAVPGQVLPALGDGLRVDKVLPADGAPVIGPVEPGSTVTEIVFRVPADTPDLTEGNLVKVNIRDRKVLYQAVKAVVRAETTDAGASHRYVDVSAGKIGVWDSARREFARVPWLPAAGESVTLDVSSDPEFQKDSIGRVPGSNYGIKVDPGPLVTHNTAVLGILGIGKTYLTFELMRRVMASGCKVLAIDITKQYAAEFAELLPPNEPAATTDRINNAISPHRMQVSRHVHLGGNVIQFVTEIESEMRHFLSNDLPLSILDPTAFDVMRQDSKPFDNQASMAPLTVVETTRIIAESVLKVLSSEMSETARLCLILEEAHSLAPEWNSTTYEGDRQASNAVAKAVLQGRKYGLGVILVTQRTANVTKTILNQCNTVFALRTFDATGMEFLRNYVGSTYADVLSGLEERTAVVFGRASSCATPVMVRLNEHDEMVEGYWNEVKDPLISRVATYAPPPPAPPDPPPPLRNFD